MGQVKRKRWGRCCQAVVLFAAAGFTCAPVARAQQMQVETTIEGANDNADQTKNTGFSIKKEDQKIIEQFEDFERYRDKKAWEKAFKSLDGVLKAAQTNGMAPSKDGFWIPSRQKVLQSLVSLPPEGKAAYRLFYDATAKQSWSQVEAKEAAGESDTITPLREIVRQYFITSVGDKASDHLGDALFEIGDYTGAARAWEQILTSYPETSLTPMRLQIKQATALSRAGRMEQIKPLAAKLTENYPGETIQLGGKNVSIEEHLAALAKPAA